MKLAIVYKGKRYEMDAPDWESAKAVIDVLKRARGRFDPEAKTWSLEHMPCNIARLFRVEECQAGRFWKSFFFTTEVPPQQKLEELFCFKVVRWRQASCREYCEDRCEDAFDVDRCVDRCTDRCMDEGWTPRMQVEEKICLHKLEGGELRIPRGLALRVTDKVRYVDLPPIQSFEGLRDYQAQVVNSAWGQLQKIGAATIQMATGAGKSYTAGFLAKRLEEAGYKVFVTALQLDLIYQLRDFAAKFGAKPTAVTVQTLWNRLREAGVIKENGFLSSGDEDEEEAEIAKAYSDETPDAPERLAEEFTDGKVAVILDEVHHLPARTVKIVAMAAGDGDALRIGLSATPWRNDGRDLEIYAYMGDVVEPRISSSYLIERGYAVPVTVKMVKTGDWGCSGGQFAEVRRCLAENEKRNALIGELVRDAPKPALVLTSLVKHAHALGNAVKKADSKLVVSVVTGAVKGDERKAIYDAVRQGKIDVLVATTLADEGLDLPPLRSAVIALGGRSKTRVLQRIGRLVRPWPGKDRALALDIWDSAPFYSKQGEERLSLYKTEPAWEVEVAKLS